MYDFEIRVGKDEDDLANNPICFKEFDRMTTGTQRFPCSETLLGDWVSINKTAGGTYGKLALSEVLVFGSKYSCMHSTDTRIMLKSCQKQKSAFILFHVFALVYFVEMQYYIKYGWFHVRTYTTHRRTLIPSTWRCSMDDVIRHVHVSHVQFMHLIRALISCIRTLSLLVQSIEYDIFHLRW